MSLSMSGRDWYESEEIENFKDKETTDINPVTCELV